MITFRLTAALAFVLVCCLASAAEPRVSPVYKELLTISGLGHLSSEDMAKVEELVAGMNKASTERCTDAADAYESVVSYLKRQGFEPEMIILGSRDRKDVIIVGKTLRQYTSDIPISFPTTRFRNGVHFVRKSTFGVTAIIVDGELHEFRLAEWLPF